MSIFVRILKFNIILRNSLEMFYGQGKISRTYFVILFVLLDRS